MWKNKVFAPNGRLTLAALPVLAGLCALGSWQVQRYGETTAAIERYHVKHDVLPAVTSLAEAAHDPKRLETLNFRRADLQGTLEPEHVQLLTARYVLAKRGFGVLAPLRVTAGPFARILVHLGWVPEERLGEYLDQLKKSPPTHLAGRLQVAPDNAAQDQPVGRSTGHAIWLRPEPAALATRIAGLDPQLMLQAGQQASGKEIDIAQIPVQGYVHPVRMTPQKHVEYAATWFGLAATLVAVWVSLSLKDAA